MSSSIWLRVLLLMAVLCLSAGHQEDPQGGDLVVAFPKKDATENQKKNFPCYEDDLRSTPVISRDSWNEKKNSIYSYLPLHNVVVLDGGKRCKTHQECIVSLSAELRKTVNGVCSALENFYIGGNGEVYEGRGWHVAPYWHLNGMRRTAVTVKFLGSHESEGPSEEVLRAFWRMVKSGVWEKKLSVDYRVVSMGQVYNDSTLVGDALEKVFRESEVGLKEISMVETWEITPDDSLPLITREEWGAKNPTNPMTEILYRFKYLIINEGGEQCFTPQECVSRMKAEQERQQPFYGDVADNFYIGGDGYVYEGRGFLLKPAWDVDIENKEKHSFKEDSMTVKFFGNFQSDVPSEKAIGAFKLLVNAGKSLHKISDGFEIYSLRGIYNDSRFLGDEFHRVARKWKPWATELDARFVKKSVKGDSYIGLVKRKDWEEKVVTKELEKIKNHPIDYVIIKERTASDRCLNSIDCISLMREIQEKDLEKYGDVQDNFYVSDNGNIYEGRGWDTEPQFRLKYFNRSMITVTFIRNHKVRVASLTSTAAFENLLRTGVNIGKIAPNYHLYSSRNIYNADVLLGDGLKKYYEKTEKWSMKLDALTENERMDSGLLPIIPHKDWSDIPINSTHHSYKNPVKHVVIGKAGERCFTYDECVAIMKENEKESRTKGLSGNFYIGDDGLAYEGRGWTFAPGMHVHGLKSEFYYIEFIGKYGEESSQSDLSILALIRLLENGVRTNKLSPDFKIISVHQIFGIYTSDTLYKVIKTWDRWTSDFHLLQGEDTPSVDSLLVRRADWHAEKPLHTIPIPEHPLSYVVVHSVGDHCNDLSSCIQSLQTIQKNTPPRNWDVADNFYVGDDGHIYEGRGWDTICFWSTKGIDKKVLSIGFLGSFDNSPPSPKALIAFQILLQRGVVLGKLIPSFETISLGEVIKDNIVVVGEKLTDALKVTESWSDEFELKYDRARLRSLNSSLVLSDEWNQKNLPVRMSSHTKIPIKYIAIRDGGESCDNYDACVRRMNEEHSERHKDSNDGVAENFYVGNDGNVYEGAGWDWDMLWDFDNWQSTVSVQFLGRFEYSLPSAKALQAVKDVIIKDGIETGKLSPNYTIGPIPYGHSRTIGRKLRLEIMTWENSVPTF